ncbi:uncharacterized protein KGF55_005637 [Candida pseudojiufengensis]|uniref:uncharacterized protein n=1 Tax=Candida pseudojiufengensis TaxID=497109 RepID=UPI002224C6EA|nr:uncharacterized protein KGF55_005637 [Candida pseudojiufengensis]KAI5958983.1 hypothetical protein KGF55_005637 [Candida pseudojiufengensis]
MKVHSDLMGPFTNSTGKVYATSLIDHYSKYAELILTNTKSERSHPQKLRVWNNRFPNKIISYRSDNGTEQPRSQDLESEFGIIRDSIPVASPKLNGLAENFNYQILKNVYKVVVGFDERILVLIEYILNVLGTFLGYSEDRYAYYVMVSVPKFEIILSPNVSVLNTMHVLHKFLSTIDKKDQSALDHQFLINFPFTDKNTFSNDHETPQANIPIHQNIPGSTSDDDMTIDWSDTCSENMNPDWNHEVLTNNHQTYNNQTAPQVPQTYNNETEPQVPQTYNNQTETQVPQLPSEINHELHPKLNNLENIEPVETDHSDQFIFEENRAREGSLPAPGLEPKSLEEVTTNENANVIEEPHLPIK